MSQPLEHSTVVELTRARSGQTAVCQIADMGASVINVEAFFFSSRRRHTRSLRDWSSDVSSSDLMLGLFAFFYAVVHFSAYLVLDLELNFRLLGADIVKRPYITIGFSALLLLLPLALTSTNGMMRRLGRRWQSLHRLIYPIAALAVWHFYWQVKRDVREPLLYVGILALLLAYRLLRWRARGAPRAAPATAPAAQLTSRSGSATAPERT